MKIKIEDGLITYCSDSYTFSYEDIEKKIDRVIVSKIDDTIEKRVDLLEKRVDCLEYNERLKDVEEAMSPPLVPVDRDQLCMSHYEKVDVFQMAFAASGIWFVIGAVVAGIITNYI